MQRYDGFNLPDHGRRANRLALSLKLQDMLDFAAILAGFAAHARLKSGSIRRV
jgi:hypothetical protein